LVVQVTRRATRLWIRYLLKTKNPTAHNASRRTITIAAITPPEGRWEELFASPTRAESAGADEITPPATDMVVLPETGLWRTVLDVTADVVRVYIGNDDDDDDDDDDDSMISDEAETMELGTGSERGNPPGVGCVAIEVEPPTTVLGVGMSPMLDACTSATTAAGTGVPVVRTVGVPSWS